MREGNTVLWINHEMSGSQIEDRLRPLRCSQEMVDKLFIYIKPAEALTAKSLADVQTLLGEYQPRLVVVDAFSGALDLDGRDDNANGDVERWFREVGDFLWDEGKRCLLVLDHVVKDIAARRNNPAGSKRKLERVDVGLAVTATQQMTRVPPQDGMASLTVRKDRDGYLTQPCAGMVSFHVTGDGTITWTVDSDTEAVSQEKPITLHDQHKRNMEEASRIIEARAGITKGDVKQDLQGAATAKVKAIDALVAAGYVKADKGSGQTVLLTSVKSFRCEQETD